MSITGGLTLNTGSILDFELGAPTTGDLIIASGTTNILGGTLNITNAGGMAAGLYPIIDYAGTLSGSVANLALGTTPAGFSYALMDNGSAINLQISSLVTNDADFNDDGFINAGDYPAWRKFNPLATGATQITGDANGDGDNDDNDYLDWKATYGQSSPGAGGGGSGAVPEPTGFVMLLLGLAALAGRRRG
jgi:hypothetical protein